MQYSALLSQNTFFYLKRELGVFHEEHVKLRYADGQITVGEVVRYVETQRPEFSSLEQSGVKHAQREQQTLENSRLRILRMHEILHLGDLSEVRSQHVSLLMTRI